MTITGNFEHFTFINFETSPLIDSNLSWNTRVPLYIWKYYDLKCNILIQNCPVKSQREGKQEGEYKMDLSHRKEFATNYFNLLKIEIYVLVRIGGSEIFIFQKIWRTLFSWNTRF